MRTRTQFQVYNTRVSNENARIKLESNFEETRVEIIQASKKTEQRLKDSLEITKNELTTAQDKIQSLLDGQKNSDRIAVQTQKIQRCSSQLEGVREFATLWGLFNDGFVARRHQIPYQSQVDSYRERVKESRHKGKEDALISQILGLYKNKLYGNDPGRGWSKFKSVRESIKELGCTTKWSTKSISYQCACELE